PSSTVQTVVARQKGAGSDNTFWLGLHTDLVRFTVNNLPLEAPAAPIPTGRWTHVAASYDGTQMVIYVGGLEASRLASAPPLAASTSGVTLGADLNGSDPDVGDRFFHGRLDQVVLYNRALSP